MISLIVAVDENYMIGKGNTIPWRCKEDLQNFKKITMGCPIIMGRKTYESLPKLLPGREHFVITTNPSSVYLPDTDADRLHICSSLREAINGALACAEPKTNFSGRMESPIEIYEDEVFIIGGEYLYNDVMNKDIVDRVVISMIKLAVDPDESCKYFLFEQWKSKFTLFFEKDFEDFTFKIWDRDPVKKWI